MTLAVGGPSAYVAWARPHGERSDSKSGRPAPSLATGTLRLAAVRDPGTFDKGRSARAAATVNPTPAADSRRTDMLRSIMEWPRPGDSLFAFGSDYHNNACVDPHASLHSYGSNYKDAADSLIEAVAEGREMVDAVIGPIVFLYRHYFELRLKEIVWVGNMYERVDETFPRHHDLSALWREAKRSIRTHYGHRTPGEMDNLDLCVKDFNTHDPDSSAFRYPWDKKGKRTLATLRHINVRHLAETMQRASCFLDCISSDMWNHLESREQSAEG